MLTKKFIKSRQKWQVVFEVPANELPVDVDVQSIQLVGDFNQWDPAATPMKRNRRKVYRATLELEPEQSYQFRYLVNGAQWLNDWHADAYIPGSYGQDNCVVLTGAVP
ncbi:MAG: isoamylase early set domain-containing protein [Caldilineaceae bacterium]|nr:isoamylase early set domain-containing protein [Caldilineaceae bacterium]